MADIHGTREELVAFIGEQAKVIAALRERERTIIDHTWGCACGDGSVPSTKIQDKIIAAIEQTAEEST